MRLEKIYTCFIILSFPLFLSKLTFADEKITLRVVNWAGAEELKLEQANASDFMKKYPNIEVIVETIPTGFKEKILTNIASGNPPDVFLLDSGDIPSFVNEDALIDLRPYVKKFNIDLSTYFPDIIKIAERNGKLYAFPKDFNLVMMYYNKRLFKKVGVDFPEEGWTWDDFIEKAQRLTIDFNGDDQIDQYGTAISSAYLYWEPFLWTNKADILSLDGKTALGYFNSPEAITTGQFLADLMKEYKVSPSLQALTGSGLITGMFMSNRVAMIPDGHWRLIVLKKYIERGELDIGVIHLPTPQNGQRATVMYESGWCVPRGTLHEEWAVRLAAHMAGVSSARRNMQMGIALSPHFSVAKEQIENDTLGLEKIFFNEIPYARQPWGTKIQDFRRLTLIAKDALEEVMIKDVDVKTAFTQASYKMDQELALSVRTSEHRKSISPKSQIFIFLLIVCFAVGMYTIIFLFLQKQNTRRKELVTGYKFLAPSIILFSVFILTPILFSLYLSLHQWNIINPYKPFVGLENYIKIFKDPYFLNALKNTALFTLQVPVAMMISLVIALLMNQRLKGVNFLRVLFFLPSITSFVAIAMVWQWIYHPQFGLINFLLAKLGFSPLPWLTHPSTALISIMIMTIWMHIGYQMVIYLAGLQGIPEFLYDAARIDGASVWNRFRHITFPLLAPTTFFILVTSLISSFQVFTSVYVMTEGGPSRSTDVVVYHIYQNAWEYLKMGSASAMSWVLFCIILLATFIQFKLMGKKVYYA